MAKKVLKGFYKIQEEIGELGQVLGKLGPFPKGKHPDGGKDLYDRLEEELADVQAAILYMIWANGLSRHRIKSRVKEKVRKFATWGLTGIDGEET